MHALSPGVVREQCDATHPAIVRDPSRDGARFLLRIERELVEKGRRGHPGGVSAEFSASVGTGSPAGCEEITAAISSLVSGPTTIRAPSAIARWYAAAAPSATVSYISIRGRVSADDEANQAAAKPSRTALPTGCCLPESGNNKAMLVTGPLPIVTKPGCTAGPHRG